MVDIIRRSPLVPLDISHGISGSRIHDHISLDALAVTSCFKIGNQGFGRNRVVDLLTALRRFNQLKKIQKGKLMKHITIDNKATILCLSIRTAGTEMRVWD